MKFILNKCKVIQLGKYNLTPWRLGERHLESSNTEQPEGQQITLGFAIHYGGLRNRRLYTDSSGFSDEAERWGFCFPAWGVTACYSVSVCEAAQGQKVPLLQ